MLTNGLQSQMTENKNRKSENEENNAIKIFIFNDFVVDGFVQEQEEKISCLFQNKFRNSYKTMLH